MLLKSEIEQAFLKQQEQFLAMPAQEVSRFVDYSNFFKSGMIEVISGIRRAGKSVLLQQIRKSISEKSVFMNFEDPRIFNFEIGDFPKLDEIIGDSTSYYFFDEIQNVEHWEQYIRQLHDRGKKVFITGSNASLLSKDLGTRLTGRYIHHELFPFSFDEFKTFHQLSNSVSSFESYLLKGGFPEFNKTEQVESLQPLFKDILLRDIAIRYGIRNTRSLLEIAFFLISTIGKEYTYTGLKKAFSFGSVNTVSDYLQWMEDAYLFFYLPRFSWSAKSSLSNPRKVYSIDTALARLSSLSYSKDSGRLFENAVFLHLRRQNLRISYFRENKECDFITFKYNNYHQVIQVCTDITSDNKKRETEGLLEAMNFFDKNEGFIITQHQKDEFIFDGKHILLVPAHEYFENFL